MLGSDTNTDGLAQRLKQIVSALSLDIGPRCYTQRERLAKAAEFIENQMNSYGLAPERQFFLVNGMEYSNVYTEVKGTESTNEIIVIGAHYDTVCETPGADDNASGIAGMLETARLIAESPAVHTILFAAFTLEEPPFFRTRQMGSYIFAEYLHKRNTNIKGMISLEMIGYFTEKEGSQYYPMPLFRWFYPDSGNYIAFVGNLRSRNFANRFTKLFKSFSSVQVESLNATSLVPGIDFSDHLSFWRFDYPAFMITDTAFYRNPHYHAPSDTPETLNYEKMSQIVLGIHNTLRQI